MICTICGNICDTQSCPVCGHGIKTDLINSIEKIKDINESLRGFAEAYADRIIEERSRIKNRCNENPVFMLLSSLSVEELNGLNPEKITEFYSGIATSDGYAMLKKLTKEKIRELKSFVKAETDKEFISQIAKCLERIASEVQEQGVLRNGNAVNKGLYYEADGRIYFSNDKDKGFLYQMKSDGSDLGRVTYDECSSVVYYDGYIYYSNASDGSCLYRITPDGKKRKKICNDMVEGLNILDGYIYYISGSDRRAIYKIAIDGTERQRLDNDGARELTLYGDTLYFVNCAKNDSVYAIKTDGSQKKRLIKDEAAFINIYKNRIYYKNETNNGAIYSANIDGQETTEVIPNNASYINVYKDKIYFSNKNDKNRLYRCNLDGSELKCLCTDNVLLLNVAANTLYFKSVTERGIMRETEI